MLLLVLLLGVVVVAIASIVEDVEVGEVIGDIVELLSFSVAFQLLSFFGVCMKAAPVDALGLIRSSSTLLLLLQLLLAK